MPTVRGAATTVEGDVHPAGRLAACPGRRHAGRPAPVAAGPRRAPARRPDRAGHPGRHPRLGAPRVRRPRHGRPARRRGARRRGRGHRPGRPGRRAPAARTGPASCRPGRGAGRAAGARAGVGRGGPRHVRHGVGRDRARPGGPRRRSPASPAASAGPRRGSPRRPPCRSCSPASTRTSGGCSRRWRPGHRSGAAAAVRTRRTPSPGCWPAGCSCGSTPRPSSCPARSGSRCAATGRWARSPSTRRTSRPWTAASATVDGTAAGAALRALRQVEQLVAFWATTPPPALRSGGLGVRELRRAAREVDADETHGRAARRDRGGGGPGGGERRRRARVGADDHGRRLGGRGPGAEVGRAGPRLARPAARAGARRHPGRRRAADRRAVRRPAPPDGAPRPAPGARRARRAAAGNGRGRPPKRSPACWRGGRRGGAGGCATRSCGGPWPRRRCWASSRSTRSRRRGGPCSTEPARAASALRAALPEPVGHVLLQADLTAVAPGPLEPELEHELDLVGEVESAGGATVYRFTEATVRRALDAGRTAAELHELFATRSATPVPQGLTYLVDDVARKHGRLRGGAAASFLRSDDEVLIAEVLASPAAGPLELRRIAPTVAVSPLPLAELMDGLRGAGFTPAAEDEGGAVLDLTDRGRRIPPRRRSGPPRAVEPDPEQLRGLVARMRAGDALAGLRRSGRAGGGPRARRRDRRDPPRGRARAAQRVDRLRRRPRGGGRAGAGADERRRRGRRGPRQRGRRPAPRPAAPDHLDRAGRRTVRRPGRAAATRLQRPSGTASRARPARSGSASPTRGRGRRS